MEWMLMPYRKLYRLIEGRSSRREYWMFFLLVVLVYLAMAALFVAFIGGAGMSMVDPSNLAGMMTGAGGLMLMLLIVPFYFWLLLTGVAAIAVTIRRIHDLGYSGWMYLVYPVLVVVASMISPYLIFAVFIGYIVVMCLPGTAGANKYGSDPLDGTPGANVFA